jgi:FkbM family methyltransferase
MVDDSKKDFIALHHIGSRGGSRSFPLNTYFEEEMINVLYDADSDCIEQIKEVSKNLKSELIIYPKCISSKKEKLDFFITNDPNLSSFFMPKKLNLDYYYFSHAGYDYSFNNQSKIEKIVKLETTTLDSFINDKKSNFFMPDFLSLDTQGSELEIIDGSPICISNSLAVILEAEFLEFYENQPCFEDILKSMKIKGFEFIRFTNVVEQKYYKYPIGLRSRGKLTDGDALFIRSPEYLKNTKRNNAISYYKLAYIYLSFEMLESALECLKKIEQNWGFLDTRKYMQFLNKLYKVSKKFNTYPETYSDLFTFQESKHRYTANKEMPSNVKLFFKNLGVITLILKFLRKISNRAYKSFVIFFIIIKNIKKFKKNEIEILLEKNGFSELSKVVYDSRISFIKSDFKIH